jgi:archaellum component FlaC
MKPEKLSQMNTQFDVIQDQLEAIKCSIIQLSKEIKMAQATLDDVVTKITNISNLEDALIASNKALSDKLDAAIATGDMAKVQAIADALDADAAKLAAAAVANTPAAPTA